MTSSLHFAECSFGGAGQTNPHSVQFRWPFVLVNRVRIMNMHEINFAYLLLGVLLCIFHLISHILQKFPTCNGICRYNLLYDQDL